MQKINNNGFTLVELLVVITILSIISVVAYQNFGGATDKAISWRKINDIGTIETALQQFKADNNYYPMPMLYSSGSGNDNLWWYNTGTVANPSNTLKVVYSGKAIASLTGTIEGWWRVYWTWAYSGSQIWAKWVMWYSGDFGKKYLSKDLYDPEIWDIQVGVKKMIDSGIGRYVYAVFAQPRSPTLWNNAGVSAIYYNIATSVKKKDSETYESYIVWDFDEAACEARNSCPDSLIGTASWWIASVLKNKIGQDITTDSTGKNQWIPYPIKDFAQ